MALAPKLIKQVADDIADALSTEELKGVVRSATGNELFKEYAVETDPPRRAVYRTLETLLEQGTERWLLTYVLVRSIAKDELRKFIVKVYPAALMPQPTVRAQVQKVIETLDRVKAVAIKPEYLDEFKTKSVDLPIIVQKISTLYAYKSLHEALHALQLQLTFRPPMQGTAGCEGWLADFADCQNKITLAATKAAAIQARLAPPESVLEDSWVAALNTDAARLQSQLAAMNPGGATDGGTAEFSERLEAAQSIIEEVKSIIRQQLVRLNQRMFDTANDLSLEELIAAVPDLVHAEDCFETFQHSIRELSPTVLARALVHKIWQDADKEIALIEGVLELATADSTRFREHWMSLRPRLLWLTTLEPQAEWSINAVKEAKAIDEKLFAEAPDQDIEPLFENLRNFAKYRFFAVDHALKDDCDSLGGIDAPLKQMLQDIRNA